MPRPTVWLLGNLSLVALQPPITLAFLLPPAFLAKLADIWNDPLPGASIFLHPVEKRVDLD